MYHRFKRKIGQPQTSGLHFYGKISRVIIWRQLQRHIHIDVVHVDWYPDACQLPLLWPHLIDEDQRLLSVEHGASLQRVLTALPCRSLARDTAPVTLEVSDVDAAVMIPKTQFRCLVGDSDVPGHTFSSLPWDLRQTVWTLTVWTQKTDRFLDCRHIGAA